MVDEAAVDAVGQDRRRASSVSVGSPQLSATLPSRSYTTTGGAGIDCEPSCGSSPPGRKPRFTVTMRSSESMQLAPTIPVTHW